MVAEINGTLKQKNSFAVRSGDCMFIYKVSGNTALFYIVNGGNAMGYIKAIKEFFTGSRYETAPIIPTSAANKLNTDSIIKWLTQQKPKDLIEGSNRIVFNIIHKIIL
jgi:hypothetical protein